MKIEAQAKANGLVQPIVVDSAGVLIDGRNRLEACRRAGVEPTFTTLNGHDPVALILSSNVQRRHLSKGQQAMAVAKAGVLSQNSVREIGRETGVSSSRLAYARLVLSYTPEPADSVLAGSISLDTAYAQAQEAKRQKEERERHAQSEADQLVRLRSEDRDLADLVVEERLTLVEGARRPVQARLRP